MKSILYVHDHQENPWQKKQLLESAGMRVELAKTSNDCMISLDKSCPDVVMMDVLLEGSNGFELCQEIRRRHLKSELPILLCAGIYQGDQFRQEAEKVGANVYLTEAFDLEKLVPMIAEMTTATTPASTTHTTDQELVLA